MRGWEDSVETLKSVGKQRAQQLARLGIHTVGELLRHYPREYMDFSAPKQIAETLYGETAAVRARVVERLPEKKARGGLRIYDVLAEDGSARLKLRFFNAKYAAEGLRYDTAYLFYGKIEPAGGGGRLMPSPYFCPAADAPPFLPVYRLTKGLGGKTLANLISQALDPPPAIPEPLPREVREEYRLLPADEAIRAIHRPRGREEAQAARRRLIFEELFTLAAGLARLKMRSRGGGAKAMEPHDMEEFYRALPFRLTGAQHKAIGQMTADLCKDTPMGRLVQGDVGSGKTMVAAAGAYFTFLSGGQSALMAPTELLARQHYQGLSGLLEGLGMRCGLLLGSMTPAQKRGVYERLETGEIDFCIGTHALLSQGVTFQRLWLVITDEQHRFGVAQRAALQEKGLHPHTLVMSATPIPRTLALMIYGELELSVIDELPPGRSPVLTYKISSPKRDRALNFILQHVKKGLQAYVVCPLVEAGEETPENLRAAADYVETLRKKLPGCTVGLLHGKMKTGEKDSVMSAFSSGEISVLVSTTVVEVGVDVPNAVIMMVENAERFGLSQLHQLRGRVGRGKEQSYCILLSDSRSPETLERLRMMCSTNDGFQIAEYDLRTRGPGNFLGQRQHGLPEMRLADLTTDLTLVEKAWEAADKVVKAYPELNGHQALRGAVEKLMEAVGERPN